MSAFSMDLQWSPTRDDHLITWAQDIVLYEVEDIDPGMDISTGCLCISDTKAAMFVAKVGDFRAVDGKVIDAYPGSDAEGMIAVGLPNGKVVLTSFGASIISKEFVPKHARQINSLQWNNESPNFLAAGLDKARSDYAVAIWDVSASSKFVNGFHSDALRPAIELGVSETAHSVAWVESKSLLVGMNQKHIKLFDLRDPQPKLGSTASTKAVYGISVDNLANHRVASYAENHVFVWDMRNFDKPFVVLNHSKPISKIGWCPTRSGLLACLEKDSTFITLHDVHHAAMSTEEGEPAVLDRRLTPSRSSSSFTNSINGSAILSSFAWHPTEENLLTTATSGGSLWNSIVFERITLNWSPTSKMGWSNGKRTIQYIDNTDQIYAMLDDISVKMKNRAGESYGLKSPLKENGRLVQGDPNLVKLWEWLDYCRSVTEKEKYRVPSIGNIKFPGARAVLRIDPSPGGVFSPMKSEIIHNTSFDLHTNKTYNLIYRSEERSFVQQLCGWSSDTASDSQGPHTRKAAIALFHLKLKQAIKILNDSGHTIVAMAIAGFTEEKSSLWRELAHTNCSNLTDPYIRAIFAFLTESDTNYETILNECELTVADRLGFACSFLPDSKLISFVQDLTTAMVKKGNLDAILLTGMTQQGLPLLQKYLDMTGDVQTVALLTIRTMAMEIPSTQQLKTWIDRYSELLDSWKLWEHRAEFDIMKNTNNTALIPQPEVTISCNFCGKSISPVGLTGLARNTQLFSRFTTTNAKLKLSCCPSCRKPLPRCAICLLHMGTILGSGTEPIIEVQKTGASAEALSWYTWCQSCRHGGHTIHLQHWFQNQSECPVTACSCKCITLDKVIDFPS